MAGMLELSGWEFKTTMINMQMTPMDTIDSMQEQMGNVSGELDILINHKEVLEIKNTVTEMKSIFEGLISRLDLAEERISELENISLDEVQN